MTTIEELQEMANKAYFATHRQTLLIAASELETLQKENVQLRAQLAESHSKQNQMALDMIPTTVEGVKWEKLRQHNRELQKENAELQRDKERLDWLQFNSHGVEMLAGYFRIYIGNQHGPSTDIRNTSLRAAIDAAMQEKP